MPERIKEEDSYSIQEIREFCTKNPRNILIVFKNIDGTEIQENYGNVEILFSEPEKYVFMQIPYTIPALYRHIK